MTRLAILAVSAAALLASCGSGEAGPSVRQFMMDEVQPTADIFWKSSGSISDENGITDLTPTTEEGWKRAQDATKKLAEYGELLQTEPYAKDRGEGWIRLAKGLVDISKRAEQSVIERDSDKMFEIGGYVYDVCKACHQAYPATEAAEATGIEE